MSPLMPLSKLEGEETEQSDLAETTPGNTEQDKKN